MFDLLYLDMSFALVQEGENTTDYIKASTLVKRFPHSLFLSGAAPHIQHSLLQSEMLSASIDRGLASPGRPLNPALRRDMEQRFGYDFSRVRVHCSRAAEQSARDVNANAYTVGYNIVFGTGQFDPQTSRGQKLLVHELAHVTQPKVAISRGLSQPGDAGEREADQAVNAFSNGDAVMVGTSPGAALQRQSLPDTKSDTAGDKLLENAEPFLAAAMGSATLDRFETGKSDLKPDHKTQLASVAHNIQVLLRKYNLSTVNVMGFTDTVGEEANNLNLGQARADVVRQALTDLGVPEAIMLAESKGETGPQALKTKDEVPSAQNRRVQILFRPQTLNIRLETPQLKLPSEKQPPNEFDPMKRPPIDLKYHPKIEPPDPTKLRPDFWKPIPPAPKGSGPKSLLDMIGEKTVDPVIDKVAGWLPKQLREKLKDAARDAVKSGVAKSARAAAEAVGITDTNGLDAIEKAAEAAIQEKEKSPQ